MEEFKGTKGYWVIGALPPNGCNTIGSKKGEMVAMMAHSVNDAEEKEVAIANTLLVVESPNILEELMHLVESLKPLEKSGQLTMANIDLNGARAVISRALGGGLI